MRCVIPILAVLFGLLSLPTFAQTSDLSHLSPPSPSREFRGVWIATAFNSDWPSEPGLPSSEQQKQLVTILDKAASLHFNAVILQIRSCCDAFYASKYDPWSQYLEKTMGQPPTPFYDPLSFAVSEAHKRGLELHVWFNLYRAYDLTSEVPIAPNHISQTHPEYVRKYGNLLWLDPGAPGVQDYLQNVIMDVVTRYDVDGVNIDDYYYPFKINGPNKKPVDFPDDSSWSHYQKSGGTLSRDDWRRQNINDLIHSLYVSIKKGKPWVKFGITPFGIWRPGHPAQIKGLDAVDELYADSRLWLQSGWLDYFGPQLYWRISQTPQGFPALLQWWTQQNTLQRHLWPGIHTDRVRDKEENWNPDEIIHQIQITRSTAGVSGTIHFSAQALMNNQGGIGDQLQNGLYAEPALVPASPWLNVIPPSLPKIQVAQGILSWTPTEGEPVWLWVVQLRHGKEWTTQILPTQTMQISVGDADAVSVYAVSRCGIDSAHAVLTIP